MERFAADCAPFLSEDAFLAVRRFLAGILLMAPDSFLREKFAAVEARRVLRTRLRHRSLIECANPRGHIASSGVEFGVSLRASTRGGPEFFSRGNKAGCCLDFVLLLPVVTYHMEAVCTLDQESLQRPRKTQVAFVEDCRVDLALLRNKPPERLSHIRNIDEGESMKPWSALTAPPRSSASPRRHFCRHFCRAELP